MTQREKNKQVLATIKDGDYFNLTRPEGINETWNNQNRFATYQKVGTRREGDWQLEELFYEYAHGEYPFKSTSYWNLERFVENNDCIIEKITDPFKEGCADKKAYLKGKIQERITKHLNRWKTISEQAIQAQVKGDTKWLNDSLTMLASIIENMAIYIPFDENLKHYSHKNITNNGRVTPISFMSGGMKVVRKVLSMNPTEKYFIVERDAKSKDLWEKVPFDEVLPNDNLYPIDFGWQYPWDSVTRKSELESLAQRIMYFTEIWEKPLQWKEYEKTLSKDDTNYKSEIKRDFDRLQPYLKSLDTLALFSEKWRELVQSK